MLVKRLQLAMSECSAARAGFAVAVLLAAAVLSACSQPGRPLPVENAIEEMAQVVVPAGGDRPVPAPAPAPEPPAVAAGAIGERADAGPERFDLAVDKVAAKDFFLGLVAGSGVNIAVHPEVAGDISLELNDVSVAEVLRVTRDIYGYEYARRDGIYTIYPRKLRTEVFPINYLDIKRVGVSDTSVAVGRISAANNSGNRSRDGDRDAADSADLLGLGATGGGGNGNSGLVPGSRVQTLTRTDFWASLQQVIVAIIGGEEQQRAVVVSPQAGMVVVKALPRQLQAVRDFLQRSELSVKRQVVLETKILEVRLSDEFEAGINWGQIGGQLLLGRNVAEFSQPNTISAVAEANGEVFASLIKVNDISSLLSLLETQGNVQVLSSPRVATINNQKAIIRVGSDEFFVTGVTSDTTATAGSTVTSPTIDLTPFFSGISLDVTPQIAANGDVILHIHPLVSAVTDQTKTFTIGDEEFSLPLAFRDIRESDSIVRARSGEVVVLGGLMQETIADNKGKRPFIGDIPLLNVLFKTKNKSTVKTELVILMRPLVVGEDTWRQQIGNSKDRIREIGDRYRERF